MLLGDVSKSQSNSTFINDKFDESGTFVFARALAVLGGRRLLDLEKLRLGVGGSVVLVHFVCGCACLWLAYLLLFLRKEIEMPSGAQRSATAWPL